MTSDETDVSDARVVRLFPDYAGTPIWLSGPFELEQTGLTQDLVERLSAWEAAYYGLLTDDFEWRSTDELRRYEVEGRGLAEELAVELGSEFQVEYRSFERANHVETLRSPLPATNEAAHTAFVLRVDRAARQWKADREVAG